MHQKRMVNVSKKNNSKCLKLNKISSAKISRSQADLSKAGGQSNHYAYFDSEGDGEGWYDIDNDAVIGGLSEELPVQNCGVVHQYILAVM